MNELMKYLNQFHKESTERCLKEMEEWAKNPVPSKEASRQAFEMHRKIKEAYPNDR